MARSLSFWRSAAALPRLCLHGQPGSPGSPGDLVRTRFAHALGGPENSRRPASGRIRKIRLFLLRPYTQKQKHKRARGIPLHSGSGQATAASTAGSNLSSCCVACAQISVGLGPPGCWRLSRLVAVMRLHCAIMIHDPLCLSHELLLCCWDSKSFKCQILCAWSLSNLHGVYRERLGLERAERLRLCS